MGWRVPLRAAHRRGRVVGCPVPITATVGDLGSQAPVTDGKCPNPVPTTTTARMPGRRCPPPPTTKIGPGRFTPNLITRRRAEGCSSTRGHTGRRPWRRHQHVQVHLAVVQPDHGRLVRPGRMIVTNITCTFVVSFSAATSLDGSRLARTLLPRKLPSRSSLEVAICPLSTVRRGIDFRLPSLLTPGSSPRSVSLHAECAIWCLL